MVARRPVEPEDRVQFSANALNKKNMEEKMKKIEDKTQDSVGCIHQY